MIKNIQNGHRVTIHIEALEIKAIIGILDFERIKKQSIVIDAKIEYNYKKEYFINYAEVILLIEGLIIQKKYLLLEDALLQIQEKILLQYPQILNFTLKIAKPDIIKNANVALSSKWLREV